MRNFESDQVDQEDDPVFYVFKAKVALHFLRTLTVLSTTACSAPRIQTQSVTNASNYQFTNLLLQQLPAHYSLSDCPIYSPLVQLCTVPSSSSLPTLLPTEQIKFFEIKLMLIVDLCTQEICDVPLFIVKTGNRLSTQIQ